MKQPSTLFLKAVLVLIGLAVLTFCIFAIPAIANGIGIEFPSIAPLRHAILVGLWATAVPFFIALYQAFKLLSYIDKNIAFSDLSVKALRNIKYAAIAMSGLYMLGMPVVFMIAEADDAPGAVLFGLLFACSPIVIAVFAAVLQKLVKSAIEIKSENDLTV